MAHGVQVDAPIPFVFTLNVPVGQPEQDDKPDVAAIEPESQATQAANLADETEPAGQIVQLRFPNPAAYAPAGQSRHTANPVVFENDPGPHCLHAGCEPAS